MTTVGDEIVYPTMKLVAECPEPANHGIDMWETCWIRKTPFLSIIITQFTDMERKNADKYRYRYMYICF